MDEAQRVERELLRLPIFPLPGAVLLPYALIPLHVFEPRYRKLIRDCQAGAGVMALANVPPDAVRERKDPPRVLPVLGAGILARVDPLPDGRSNIVVRGVLRARIVEELSTKEPYRLVRAEAIRDLPVPSSREGSLAEELRQLVLAYCARRPGPAATALLQMAGSSAIPGELADAVGAAVLESPRERQELLEMLSPEERLRRVSQRLAIALAQTEGGRGTLPN
ncbi:MAG TPA: LON peptidase substrate-binding domain-containing protein [Myxococcales bacterium]|jgi:Lon protease-like protein|nr:LON peptidase substrate-binding domain-containing protein [Myxococcales bacterium]